MRTIHKRILQSIMTISLALPLTVLGTIYQGTDQSGNTVFTDIPSNGATAISSPEPQTYKAPSAPSSSVAANTQTQQQTKPSDEGPFKYEKLAILSPADNQTVRDNAGNVIVNLDIYPDLRATDKVQLMLDGKETYAPTQSSVINITDVERGTHTIQVKIIDSNNQVILTSNAVTFFMHRARVALNNPIAPLSPSQNMASLGTSNPIASLSSPSVTQNSTTSPRIRS